MADQRRRTRKSNPSGGTSPHPDDDSPYREDLPPRTDDIEEREEHVGRADWNVSGRPGRDQPDETAPDIQRGQSPEDADEESTRDER